MAGLSHGRVADEAYLSNLRYALANVPDNTIILLEPLNSHDWPNYYLNSLGQAVSILKSLAPSNARLMFDCYHVGRSGGNVVQCLTADLLVGAQSTMRGFLLLSRNLVGTNHLEQNTSPMV
jgi:hydroxypyruvate isomerase